MTIECPAPDGSSPKQQKFSERPPMCIDPSKRYAAEMVTSKGTMHIELDPLAAPKTVNNFVFLARYHYFDGVTFHRVIPGFVLQGGDPQGTGMGGPGYKFEDELPKPGRYELGSLAMANAGPNTNGSQFFVVLKDHTPLNQEPNYTIFGQVTSGMSTVDRIAAVPLGNRDLGGGQVEKSLPLRKVYMKTVRITVS
jgi:cyclophilin family peptidyl-prolyl cis-trans isomerase